MTKKDYIKIASIIKDNKLNDVVVDDFVIMFKKDNKRFDKERFIKACQ